MPTVYDIDGAEDDQIELPRQFQERYRPDLIQRAVESIQANNRQAYGADPEAGLKHVTQWRNRKDAYRSRRGKSYPSSRTPRKISFRRGMQMSGAGGKAPQTRGGRRAHPPKSSKDFSKDINEKERRKAIRSAISATTDPAQAQERGHNLDREELPLIVSDDIESLERTSEVVELLEALGLGDELARCRGTSIRAGKGKNRGRKHKNRAGPLIVVGEDDGIGRAARNIPGVETVTVDKLNASLLAPGTHPGRLTVWSTNAIETLGNEDMYA
ncbi:MAG: 50S ribosomal protein L4 [Candidatus Nanohaloarchaeota archaeon QJJ-5]|nr:50S ribosomal protein L4 [Candidatus Nanohaloarchaeota archaeon QJJ-5]